MSLLLHYLVYDTHVALNHFSGHSEQSGGTGGDLLQF